MVNIAFMASSGQQAAVSAGQLGGLTATTGNPSQYGWPVPYMPDDELIESQKWVYVRKSKDHGKKQGETAGIILVDTDGKERRLSMEELAVLAGWEW